MKNSQPLTLIGAIPSPYTRKMIALLRYRHIPYSIIWGDPKQVLSAMKIAPPKVALLPTVLLPTNEGELEAVCDSTPIIRRLEEKYEQRSVIPEDPALAFIDYLLEDFGDEWCTKYMFHYRWAFEADADNAGTLLPYMYQVDMPEQVFHQAKVSISERQISRLGVVGSNPTTAPLIDASYRRFLQALESLLKSRPFILGSRPSACDFAIYGQLTQLIGFDPTSREIAHQTAPRVVAWTNLMEDQCGLDVSSIQWDTLDAGNHGLHRLLSEVGRVYVPALMANASAMERGEDTWEAAINGERWSQQTFPYQVKCAMWLRERYANLKQIDRVRVDSLLKGTGCEALFN